MLSQLSHNLTHAIDTLAPQKTIVPRRRQPPWVDSHLQLLQRKRDAALRRFKRTDNRTLLNQYFALRRNVVNETEQKRTTCIRDRLTHDDGQQRKLFEGATQPWASAQVGRWPPWFLAE